MIAPNRLASLTSLRFFAALLVLCQHYFNFKFGHAGVSFFYVLSGFILTYNYYGKLGATLPAKEFYWKRFARIYPTHALALALAIPLAGFGWSAKYLLKLFANASLIQSFVPSSSFYFSFNAPSWSISDEAFFYALFPLLLPWLLTRGWKSAWVPMAAVAVAAAGWMAFYPGSSAMDDPRTHWLFYINPLFRLPEFIIGIWLGVQFRGAAANRSLGTVWEVLAIVLAGLSLASAPSLPARAGPLVYGLWFVPAAAAIVWVFARSRGVIARVLANSWLLLLGEASFMLYMTHWLVLQYGRSLAPAWALAIAAVGVSIAGHLLFEKPVQRWLAKGRGLREVAATAP